MELREEIQNVLKGSEWYLEEKSMCSKFDKGSKYRYEFFFLLRKKSDEKETIIFDVSSSLSLNNGHISTYLGNDLEYEDLEKFQLIKKINPAIKNHVELYLRSRDEESLKRLTSGEVPKHSMTDYTRFNIEKYEKEKENPLSELKLEEMSNAILFEFYSLSKKTLRENTSIKPRRKMVVYGYYAKRLAEKLKSKGMIEEEIIDQYTSIWKINFDIFKDQNADMDSLFTQTEIGYIISEEKINYEFLN